MSLISVVAVGSLRTIRLVLYGTLKKTFIEWKITSAFSGQVVIVRRTVQVVRVAAERKVSIAMTLA